MQKQNHQSDKPAVGAFTLSFMKFIAALSSRKIFIKIALQLGSMGKTIYELLCRGRGNESFIKESLLRRF